MGAVASLEVGTEPQLREDRTRAQRSTGRLSAAGTERRRTNRRVPGVLLPVTCDRGFSTPDSRAPTSETQHAASKVDSASADSSEPTGSLETKPLWVRQSVNQAAGDQRRFWNPVGRNGLSALLPGGPSRRAICTGMLPAVLPTPPKLGSSAVCSLVFRTIFEGFILTHITVSPARLTRLCGRLPLCLPADPPTPLLRWLVFLFLETLPSAILSLSFAYSQRPLLSFFSCKGDGQCLRHTGSPWPRGH